MDTDSTEGRAASGRATTLTELGVLLGSMMTAEGVEAGLKLRLRPTDIVVSPFGKCGTTWLQQITHTLRTGGDMDFDDISRVAPWIESSTDLGLDLDAEQRANPRIFKSHLDAHRIPAGGRYIVSCRDPKDALYSMYRFMEGWFLEPGTVALDDFARGTFIAPGNAPGSTGGSYWDHLISWWDRRGDPDVLFMAYEHMKANLTGTIQTVAAFMEIDLDDELLAITERHASLSFMQQHKDRFDDKLMRDRSTVVCGLAADSESSKVREGAVGSSQQMMSPALVAEFDNLWRDKVAPALGFADYAALIEAL